MNEWKEEELRIIETYHKKGCTYHTIKKYLEEVGYYRSYESIKKAASKFGLSKRRNPQAPMSVSLPAESTDTSSGSSDSWTYIRDVQVEPSNKPEEKPYNQPSNKKHRVLVIGDVHAPFQHRYYLDFLIETYNQWKCDTVVCIGDEVDFHALSKYPQDPNGYGAGDELINAITALRPYYEAFPNVKVVTSNHTARPLKKAFEAGIPTQFLKDYKTFLDAPNGWSWSRQLEIDGVLYHHGEGYSGALGAYKAAMNAMRSTVIGHIHSHAGVTYIQTEFDRLFALNVGCGVDIEAYAFAYGKNCAFKPTLACGVVIDGKEAYCIPMSGF